MDYKAEYQRWLKNADEELKIELEAMNDNAIEDAFYRNLSFGTGGLRGVIGAGTNRMNIHVVAKASQGLANYLNMTRDDPSVVIGYDSRLKSDIFAKVTAGVLSANKVKVHIWPKLLPVPTVSYAVRFLKASAGVMITASHNPSKYNGYKVYGPDGCQITTETAKSILTQIEALDIFDDIKIEAFEEGVSIGNIDYIDSEVLDAFIEEVKGQSVLYGDKVNRDVAIVYSPLNGTGLEPVIRVLEETGFSNITIVEEQRLPDGNFPTCPYPNPEIREAMELGLQYCEKNRADILLATDPDCDRCGIAVRSKEGYRLLSGNEVGILLLDFICSQRTKHKQMPICPVFIKTIVTMDLAEKIARHYGVNTINVLTGFKFIGEVIGNLEKRGQENNFIFGFEESYGYLTGSFVRDKDAVNAVFMISEMFAYYKTRGISLLEKLEELYSTYGYCLNTLHSYELEGSAGLLKMNEIMDGFRSGLGEIAGYNIDKIVDYSEGINNLPKADVIKLVIESGSVIIRPSGTEPKLKTYISVVAEDKDTAKTKERKIHTALSLRINK